MAKPILTFDAICDMIDAYRRHVYDYYIHLNSICKVKHLHMKIKKRQEYNRILQLIYDYFLNKYKTIVVINSKQNKRLFSCLNTESANSFKAFKAFLEDIPFCT